MHDTRFHGTSVGPRSWYPDLEAYEDYTGPKPPTGKKPGLLAKTSVGQAVAEKLEGIVGPSRPKLKTVSTDFAEYFISRAYQRFDPTVFKYDWAVRGSWLIMFHFDGTRGLIDNGKRTRFLDMLVQIRQLLQ